MDEHHARFGSEPRLAGYGDRSAVSEFAVSIEQFDNETVVFAVSGEVDLATAPEFDRQLAEALGNGAAHVIIDLTACDFFDSTGLKVLTRAKRYLNGSPTLSLIVPPDGVTRRALEIARLDQVFEIFPERTAAIDGRPGRGSPTSRTSTRTPSSASATRLATGTRRVGTTDRVGQSV